jgi:hypothetical protein
LTVIVNVTDAVFGLLEVLSTTVTVTELVPTSVGVPAITPPELSRRPCGSAPPETVHVYGAVPPIAISDVEYG